MYHTLVLYPGYLDKTNFPRILTPRAPNTDPTDQVHTGPFYNPHTGPVPNFGWLFRGMSLLGSPVPIYLLGHKTNSHRILTSVGQRGQQYTQLALGSVPEFWLRCRLPRVRTTFSHMEIHLSCTPGFSIKRTFPEYWPRGLGTHRTPLQSPHGPVPELCLALLRRSAAWGIRHRSPVPIYILGLDKTNFPQILTSCGAKGPTIPTTH